MKNVFGMMLLGIAVVGMVACGGKADSGVQEQVTVVEDSVAVDTMALTADVMPKVIDFYATWCGPCKKIAPIVEELAKEYEGKVIFEKVDVDEKPDLANEYGVEAIPTLVFMKTDGTYEKNVGFMDKEALKAEIAKLLE